MAARSPSTVIGAAAALALAGAAAGCAGSTLGLAGAAVNGASYLATGRSADSHGLSWLTGEDCELARALSRAPVCRPPGRVDGALRLAAAEAEPARTALAAVYERAAAPAPLAPGAAAAGTGAAPRLYVVAASFAEAGDAAAAAGALRGLPTRVAAAEVGGATRHRVVVGPLEERLERVLAGRLAAAGVSRWFPVALCEPALAPPPCQAAGARLAAAAPGEG